MSSEPSTCLAVSSRASRTPYDTACTYIASTLYTISNRVGPGSHFGILAAAKLWFMCADAKLDKLCAQRLRGREKEHRSPPPSVGRHDDIMTAAHDAPHVSTCEVQEWHQRKMNKRLSDIRDPSLLGHPQAAAMAATAWASLTSIPRVCLSYPGLVERSPLFCSQCRQNQPRCTILVVFRGRPRR